MWYFMMKFLTTKALVERECIKYNISNSKRVCLVLLENIANNMLGWIELLPFIPVKFAFPILTV